MAEDEFSIRPSVLVGDTADTGLYRGVTILRNERINPVAVVEVSSYDIIGQVPIAVSELNELNIVKTEWPNTIFNFCFSAREIFLLIQPEVKGSKMFLLERLNLK